MPYEVTIRIEDPMLRRILRVILNRYMGNKRYTIALVFGYAVIVLLLMQNYSWYTWALAGLLVVGAVVPIFLHAMMFRRWYRKYRAEQGEETQYRFDDNGMEAIASAGKGHLPWQEFGTLVKLDDVWLLFTRRDNAFTILPLCDLNPGLRDLITGKIEAHGGEVIV